MFFTLCKRFGLLLAVCLYVVGCQTDGYQISLFGDHGMKPMFEKVVDLRQNLVFRFPQPMVKPEKIGVWDTTQLLVFSPRVVGQFKWSAVDELVFSPDQGFAFATQYAVTAAPSLQKLRPSLPAHQSIRFETEQLAITTIESQWVKEGSGSAFLRLRIALNQRVLPDELVQGLELTLGGKEAVYTLETHTPGREFTIKTTAEGLASSPVAWEASVQIHPKKLVPNLKKWLRKPTLATTQVVPAGQLEVYGLEVVYGEAETKLVVHLSQNMTDSAFSHLVEVPGIENITTRIHPLGMEVKGAFSSKAALELLLRKGITGALGGKLNHDHTIGFRIGNEDPLIKFSSQKAIYLPRHGNHVVAMQLEGVPEISVSVYQVFPNNILFNFQSGYGGEYYEENYYSEYQDDFGSLVYSRNLATRQLKKEGNDYFIPLDFHGFEGQKGLFIVRVSDAEKRYIGDKKIVAITDIGLLTKASAEEIWVQAQSIASTQPVSGASVSVIGRNNQPLFTGKTDGSGNLRIPTHKLLALNTQPRLIVCETSKDFTYLLFDQTRLETSRFPVDGIPHSTSGWHAVLFGPRNLYKPGEPVELHVLLRDRNLAAIPDVPLVAKVVNPEGNAIQTLKVTTAHLGQGVFRFTIPAYMPTGTYQVELYGAAKELLTTHSLHVEVFDPLPMEISTAVPPALIPRGKPWPLALTIDNMFGTPASQRPVDVQLTWENASFAPTGYEDYTFTLWHTDNSEKILQAQGITDARGSAVLSLPTHQIPANQGLVKIKARVQVFDEAHVPVYKTITTQMATQPALLGYKIQGNRFFLNRLNKIDLAALDAKAIPVSSKAWIEVSTKTYTTVMEAAPEEPSGYRYVSKEEEHIVYQQVVNISQGKGRFNFVPKTPGHYQMKVRAAAGCQNYLTMETYLYDGDNQSVADNEPSTEGNINISCTQRSLSPGDEVELIFQTPFDGLLAVTIEQNKVLQSHRVETKNKAAALKIPVLANMAPNVYIAATLTRPIGPEAKQNPLTTAYGYASVPVLLKDKELNTKLLMPPKTLSGVRLPVRIQVASGKETGLAVAIVDEGILQVTNYTIPDPFQYFHRKKALGVETYSMFGRIFKSLTAGAATTGGDGLYLKMGANELGAKMLVSKFIITDPAGKDPASQLKRISSGQNQVYEVFVDIPAGFAGKLRVMVVAYNNQQLGYSEQQVTVADPVTIKTSLPDYLFPGDRFESTASFFNTGNEAVSFTPTLLTKGCKGEIPGWPTSVSLVPGEVCRLAFSLTSEAELPATVQLRASTPTRTFHIDKQFEIKPPSWLIRHQVSGILKPGESTTQTRPNYLSTKYLHASVEIGNSPFLSLAPAVKQLLRYPYGCLEQTVSAAFPMVYMPSQWLESIGNQGNTVPGVKWQKNTYLADAIQKISNLQLYGGGFAYWPGAGWSHNYYSVYATHFLWEARQAGYAVDPDVLKKAIDHVHQISKENSMWVYSGVGSTGNRIVINLLAPHIPYALYVTSLTGKPNRQALTQWKAQPERLDQEGRYMLACALLLAGDGDAFNQIIPSRWAATLQANHPEKKQNTAYSDENSTSDVVKSTTQEEAFVLSALVSAWPSHPLVATLAGHLRTKIALQAEMLSTQESGMALVSLTKLMKANESLENKALARLGNQVLLDNRGGKADLSAWSQPLVLENKNTNARLYYWVEAQGQSGNGKVPEKDAGMEVRKFYYNAMGQPIDPSKLMVNDLVVVRLRVVSKTGATVNQVALADIIPPCLRIENKRIGQNSDFKTPTLSASPDYVDIRRDRIHFFCQVTVKEQSFYYAARVVARGSFFWGPAEAQAMYKPMLFSRNGGRRVVVSNRVENLTGKL